MTQDRRPPAGPQGPVILDLDETPLPQAPEPHAAPPVPEEGAGPAAPVATQALHRAAQGEGWGPGGLAGAALGALLALALALGLWDFVAGLFARHPALGWLGAGLLAVLGLVVLRGVVGEIASLARLGRIERVRALAAAAAASEGPGPARALVAELARLRGPAEPGMAELTQRAAETPDGPAILQLAERRLMPPRDRAAERAVIRAAQRVAGATAMLPNPALDVMIVLWLNLAMIRRVAEVHGGRAGWLGSWRLLRAVAAHLVATGAIAATDDLLGPLVGGGVLGRISRRFGEAAVNAALTARVGVAAIEVCRPLPFDTETAPRASGLVMQALSGWRGAKPD